MQNILSTPLFFSLVFASNSKLFVRSQNKMMVAFDSCLNVERSQKQHTSKLYRPKAASNSDTLRFKIAPKGQFANIFKLSTKSY